MIAFRAMGTDWAVAGNPALEDEAERLVRDLEARLSRFSPASALSRLNVERTARDSDLAQIATLAVRASLATYGAFDAGVGAAVVAAGYDRSRELGHGPVEAPDPRRPRIAVQGDRVELVGEGLLDLGGIAKGWTVDRLAALATGDSWWIDGGGDIRVGPTPVSIGVGEWAVEVANEGVATSSTLSRRWPGGHHLVDPRTGAPASGPVHTATVIAADTVTAEILAKSVIVDPERGLLAASAHGAEVLVGIGDSWRTCDRMRGRLACSPGT